MDVGTRLEYLRKEHQDFLHFLEEWDQVLTQTASKDSEECVRGLNRLREMQPNMKALRGHCSSEERNVEGPYREYLEKGQLERLKKEHNDLSRLLEDMFSELRFATLYQTERAIGASHEVSELARRHIQFEEELLQEIERKLAEEAEQKLLLRYTQSPE
ncbi:MAG: hemerythrin domain-containing protein [Acidobacteriota bacterium]|nr:hemerythrin domain-containing protein [Acidobacteriota bacterium]